MENNQKPEWFELADNDQIVSRKSKKKVSASKRNLTFILAGILVIPLGAGFALLSHEDQTAIAAESLSLTQDSPVVASTATSQPINTISMPTGSRDEDDDEEGDDDDRAPIFSSTAPTVTASVAPVAPLAPVATTKTAEAKAPVVITPPASSASNEIILPPTKKAGDDDDDEDDDDKKSEGKKSNKSDKDDDDEDEDDD